MVWKSRSDNYWTDPLYDDGTGDFDDQSSNKGTYQVTEGDYRGLGIIRVWIESICIDGLAVCGANSLEHDYPSFSILRQPIPFNDKEKGDRISDHT
jgi:hypothetical protein